jgi:hypothetical protein
MTDVNARACGMGRVDSIGAGNTLAIVKKKCAVG